MQSDAAVQNVKQDDEQAIREMRFKNPSSHVVREFII